VLSRPQKGAMAAIAPGGMPESMPEYCVSGKYKLFLKRRKVIKISVFKIIQCFKIFQGFVRLAMKHGYIGEKI
jgi:hypothetical protein